MEASNVKAMRAALEKIRVFAKTFMDETRMRHVTDSARIDVGDIEDLANTALAAPPRNCDVGTPEEQSIRHSNYCGTNPCHDTTRFCNWRRCFAMWAQMPYEAKEGKADGV